MTTDTQRDSFHQLQFTISDKQEEVLAAIKKAQGATLFELVKILGWEVNRISGRVTELKKQERIFDTGQRRTNPESGKSAVVWRSY